MRSLVCRRAANGGARCGGDSNGSIRHSGDEVAGDADLTAQGDDEIIFIDLDRVSPKVK